MRASLVGVSGECGYVMSNGCCCLFCGFARNRVSY